MYFGVFSEYTALPNVGTDVGDNLTVGDTAMVGTQAFVCSVAATFPSAVWLPDVATQSGALTRSYGDTTVLFAGSNFPASVADVIDATIRSGGNIDLISSFDMIYYRCRARMRAVDVGGVVVLETTTSFASLADMVTWINANVPNSAGAFTASCALHVFDQIDGSLQMPSKVYGKNRFWAGLVSRSPGHYYHNPRARSCRYADQLPVTARTLFASALHDMWVAIHGPGTIGPPAGWTDKDFSCFWISANPRRRYDMPAFDPNAFVVTAAGADRLVQSGAVPVAPAAGPWALSAGVGVYYAAIDSTITTYETFSTLQAFKTLSRSILSGGSVVVGYGLISGNGTERAVMVRPVGIDQIFFDWYDAALYQLEAVGRTRVDRHPRIRILSPLGFYAQGRMSGPVSVTQFSAAYGATAKDETTGMIGTHGYTTGEVRFQLRRLTDNAVSPLTTARVVPVVRRRARPWALNVVDGVAI